MKEDLSIKELIKIWICGTICLFVGLLIISTTITLISEGYGISYLISHYVEVIKTTLVITIALALTLWLMMVTSLNDKVG